MVRFGVIGTNWITEAFIEAARGVDGFALEAVYSVHRRRRRLLPRSMASSICLPMWRQWLQAATLMQYT